MATYSEFPSTYVWDKMNKKWSPRQKEEQREERGDLSGGEVYARIEGSGGGGERLGGGCLIQKRCICW
ncbi:hypothetical protein YC2023_010228 [Brassica napus]